MSTIAIIDEMTFDVKKMMNERMSMRKESVSKLDDECQAVDPSNFNWSEVDRNTWFICVNTNTNEGYYFPIMESENRDNNYSRVKEGMKYFISQGWKAYKIQ